MYRARRGMAKRGVNAPNGLLGDPHGTMGHSWVEASFLEFQMLAVYDALVVVACGMHRHMHHPKHQSDRIGQWKQV